MLRSHHRLVCTVASLICGIAPIAVNAQESLTDHDTERLTPRFTNVEVFGSTPEAGFLSINNRRMMAGTYIQVVGPEEGREVGFALLDRFLHPIDFENAHNVILTGINDRGVIVGLVDFTDGRPEIGFRYSRGKLEAIKAPPDASLPPVPQDINNKGDVVGWVQILSPSVFGEFGFLLSGGRMTLFAAPDATRPVAMRPNGINDKGEIVGCYDDRGFLLRNGAYTRIHVSEARSTCATDINNRGMIVGGWSDAASVVHGFLLRNGRYTIIDIPNSISSSILSINDFGDIVGKYRDTAFVDHGFKSNIREFIPRRSGHR
jgi:probable HAF family extracellular repeat protein